MHDSAFVMTSSNKCLDKNVPLYFYTSISVRPSREEKRFVSRLTPMNTNLPLKKMIARPPVERRMQLSWLGDTTIRACGCEYDAYISPPFSIPHLYIFFWKYYIIRRYWKAFYCIRICRVKQMFLIVFRHKIRPTTT